MSLLYFHTDGCHFVLSSGDVTRLSGFAFLTERGAILLQM